MKKVVNQAQSNNPMNLEELRHFYDKELQHQNTIIQNIE